MTSSDYDERIKQLFEEGAKLGASSFAKDLADAAVTKQLPSSYQHQIGTTNTTPLYESPTTGPTLTASYQPHSEVQDWMNKPNVNSNNNNSTWSKLGGSNELLQARLDKTPQVLNLAPGKSEMSQLSKSKIHLESVLQDSQLQVEYLTQKLEESKDTACRQKEHFRGAIEQLQKKLQDTLAGRKQLVDLRNREMQEQEEMIHKLQTTLKELAASNQMQEQALLDAHERMEIIQNRNQSNEQALLQIRAVLSSAFQKQKRNLSSSSSMEKDVISELVPDMFARNLENFITSLQTEADSLRNRTLQLESELNAAKQSHAAERMLANCDAAEVLDAVKAKFNETVAEERTKYEAAENEVFALSKRLKELQDDRDIQVKLVADNQEQITALNQQIDEARKQYCAEKGDVQAKIVGLEHDLRSLTVSNEKLKSETAAQQHSIAKLEKDLERANDDLHSEKEQRHSLWLKESEAQKEMNELRTSSQDKAAEISRLREIVAELRGELSTKVAREVNEAETVQRLKGEEKISEISQTNTKLREELSSAKAALETMERQISDAAVERTSALQFLQDKDQQVERLTAQLSLADRKLIEATEAKRSLDEKLRKLEREHGELTLKYKKVESALERAHSVADDRERISMQLRHQLESKSEACRTMSKETESAKRDKKRLEEELQDKTNQLLRIEGRNKSQEEMVAEYETKISKLNEEKGKIGEDVRGIEKEVARVVRDKEELSGDLREARFQVSHLIEERDSLSKQLKSLSKTYETENEQLMKEIKRKKRELQETQDTMYAVKNVDGRAAKIAAVMQNELTDKRAVIDSLKSELSKVYDKLERLQRENKVLKKDLSSAEKDLNDARVSLNEVSGEARKKNKVANGYKMATERLERALEKAATRNADAQAVIQQQEAEMAQSRIRRGLELMDRRVPPLHQVDKPTVKSFANQTSATSNSATSLQNVLVRLLTSMPPRDQTIQSGIGAHQAVGSTLMPAPTDESATTNGIFKLLSEIREQLASRDSEPSKSSAFQPKVKRKQKKNDKTRKVQPRRAISSPDESTELDIVLAHSDVTSACSEPTDMITFSDEMARGRGHEGHVFTSSPYKQAPEQFTANGDGVPSPVSILLGAGDGGLIPTRDDGRSGQRRRTEKRALRERNDALVDDKDVYDIIRKEERGNPPKPARVHDAEELCRQLQSRLEGLSEMGGKLEKQNKVAANLIKQQDRKLQKVRATGQKLR